jgi:pimeloyl-ACP methyl ester carboxylesterase
METDERRLHCTGLRDGRKLTYAMYGKDGGNPVLYFHGHGGSRLEPAILDEEDIRDAGIALIAPDRPGMGGSDYQDGRRFRDWVADTVELAEKLGLDKFGVWGVSGGGGYALACAALIPERLTGAAVVSGAGQMNSSEARTGMNGMAKLMWRLAGRTPRLTALLLTLSKPNMNVDISKIKAKIERNMPSTERAFFEKPGRLEAFLESGRESMRQGVRGIAWDTHLYAIPWDFRLEEIRMPVLLIHGEADQNVPAAAARKAAASIPNCRAIFYPGDGHISTVGKSLSEVFKLFSQGEGK